jgi:hypothetical protein
MSFFQGFNQAGFFAKLSLLVGFVPLGLAIAYVFRPAERKLAFMRPVSLAAIFAGVCGVFNGLIAVLMSVAVSSPPDSTRVPAVYVGLAESFVPAFLNFGFLAVAWLLIAVGMMRRPKLS